ncbi:MAG: NTP transferase domain-containing protein [Prevotella sp.]|nr:NTP transferase domain-containing protein [Prevotella sp.]
MLTKNQFTILDTLVEADAPLTPAQITVQSGLGLTTVKQLLKQLTQAGWVCDGTVTDQGLQQLEPYRVKRAVIMAAGFGSRMIPITLNTPKPLVRVNGVRIIEPILDRLTALGIDEIYLVRGYLGTQFDDLRYKYPQIQFIENPQYNEGNNIISVMYAKEHLCNAYVLEADLLLYNQALIKKYQYASNYLGIPVDETDDWCLYTKNNYICKVAIGGKNCYKMVGITYWTEADGKKLAQDIEKTLKMPGGKERYWDQVPLEYCQANYRITVRPCLQTDIIEIDTFNELKAIDHAYDV